MTDALAGYPTAPLRCAACGHVPTAAQFLDGLEHYTDMVCNGGFASVARYCCPMCGATDHVMPRHGRVFFGYLFATCSVNFCPAHAVEMPGLDVRRDGSWLALSVDGHERRVPLAATDDAPLTPSSCGGG